MSLLSAIFGPSQADVWQKFCAKTGAEFLKRSFWRGDYDHVVIHSGQWTILLDACAYSRETGAATTRVRCGYFPSNTFRFKIYRAGMFDRLETFFRMRELTDVHPDLQKNYVVTGTDKTFLSAFVESPAVRELILFRPETCLQVQKIDRRGDRVVHDLQLEVKGEVKDLEQLERLLTLFGKMMDHLQSLGAITQPVDLNPQSARP